ncbi:MAG: LysM peptidoglycan-binding domain-containing protein [Cetobacterium somerae]|uniref:LysM peptidoglycan-binding domain-containing protein n=1 Tax=Cetobacterium somerae TaxID=188913 RepID=UPI003F3D2491
MRKLFFINFLILYLSLLYGNSNTLEYDVKYSENNFILVTISKAQYPNLEKKYHIIKEGETLEDISDKNKIEVEKLEKINKISRFDNLKPGNIIYFINQKKGGENE